ncbi:uncharacterized protein EMH_0026550 [Eimeria mitis]|uniref:Uncharacterized protein n=1 Tax=Eimeria mitis TaxID=44415 RepID=U6KGX9_9EIME|nr:uncharacterized protein EMH_0026550 [Eimeria mitis]CDJ35507.1 hypothetical protein EMH_0026550 [Eimeria mitis]
MEENASEVSSDEMLLNNNEEEEDVVFLSTPSNHIEPSSTEGDLHIPLLQNRRQPTLQPKEKQQPHHPQKQQQQEEQVQPEEKEQPSHHKKEQTHQQHKQQQPHHHKQQQPDHEEQQPPHPQKQKQTHRRKQKQQGHRGVAPVQQAEWSEDEDAEGLGVESLSWRKQSGSDFFRTVEKLIQKPTLDKILLISTIFAASFIFTKPLLHLAHLLFTCWLAIKALSLIE